MDSDHTIIKKEIPVTSERLYSIKEENISGKKYKVDICTSQGCSQSIEQHCFFDNLKCNSLFIVLISFLHHSTHELSSALHSGPDMESY